MNVRQENIVRRQTAKETDTRHSGIIHWHHRMEIVMVVKGEYCIRVDKQERLCCPGDLAVIRSGQLHAFQNGPGCRIRIFTFDPAVLYNILPDACFPKVFITAQALEEAGLTRTVHRLLEEVLQEKVHQLPHHEPLMLTQLIQLYTLLMRHFGDNSPMSRQPVSQLRQFQVALEYIEIHYAENITLSQVAGAINYNSTYVSTLFVSCSGVNFKTYLDSFRIKKAVDLLRSTTDTVSDIAARCGYDNVRTFNNTFRRVTGQTPSQLRKSL